MFNKKEYMKQWHIKNRESRREYNKQWREDNPKYRKEYYQKNREKVLQQDKEYYIKNKEKISEYQKEFYKNNKEYISKRNKEYWYKNWEERLVQKKEYREKNKEHRKEYKKKYLKTENGMASNQRSVTKRRNKMKDIINTLTAQEWEDILESHNYICTYCGVEFDCENLPTRDHVIPISKGGHNIKGNIVPACKSCNSRKNNRINYEVLYRGSFNKEVIIYG